VLWADAESRSYAQLADALLKLKDIGFPFEWLALRYGLTPTEVANVVAMREREAEMDPVAAAASVLSGRTSVEETGDGPGDAEDAA